jgi:hypothetical protein
MLGSDPSETMEVLLEAVFSAGFAPRLYHWTDRVQLSQPRVKASSNTSTVALRVVGGNEKRTQCLGVSLGHLVPGGYKYGDLALQVGVVSNLRQ